MRWPSGRASDFKSRGPEFDPNWWHHVVSLSKTHSIPRVLANSQDVLYMTEKLLTEMLNLNTNEI